MLIQTKPQLAEVAPLLCQAECLPGIGIGWIMSERGEDGSKLIDEMIEHGEDPATLAERMYDGICPKLKECWAEGLSHGDMKPENTISINASALKFKVV